MPDEDAALAAGFALCERWAFDEAYRRYADLLFSVAMNVLAGAQDAEDCVHDVLARVWRNGSAYTADRGSVRSFLIVCVRNEALSRIRTARRRGRLSERLGALAQPAEEIAIADFVEQRRVREALGQLPADQRRALVMAFFGGKTHVEIARELGEPLGTVKSRISAALRKLGVTLRPQADTP